MDLAIYYTLNREIFARYSSNVVFLRQLKNTRFDLFDSRFEPGTSCSKADTGPPGRKGEVYKHF